MSGAILVGSFFMFGVVAITGMPPLSGFMGKLLILSASLDHSWFSTILAVVLLAGLLMIVAVVRSGSLLFYNTKEKGELPGEELNRSAMIAVIVLFLTGPVLVVFANSITAFTDLVSHQQFNNTAYIEAVLNTPAKTE